jgi:hypothetical protein
MLSFVRKIITLFLLYLTAQTGYTQTILQPDAMNYDVSVLKSTWENIHGGLYRYNTKQQIETYFKELNKKISKPMSLRNFYILIAQLNIKLNCGHSFVSHYNQRKAIREELFSKTFFPILFKTIGNTFVITHNISEIETIKPGDEIIAVNGIKTKTIIDSLLTVSKADGNNGLNKQLDNITLSKRDIGVKRFTLFDIYFPLFFKANLNEENYKVTIRQSGKISEVTVKGLIKEQREQQFIARYGAEPQDEKTWYLREINNATILFRLGDFSTYNWKFDFKKYLDSVFTHINKKGYKNLIVDIRENEGGADEARDAVLSYLTSKPIGCANPVRRLYRYTSITDSLLPNLDTWDDSYKKPKTGYTKTPDGYFEKQSNKPDCEEIIPNPNHFKGKLFLLTDVTNSSATFIMADCVKRNKLGIVVGETTGGTQQGINGGEIIFFYMPKTKIEMDIPLIWQRPVTQKPDAGIKPGYIIPTTKKDIALQNDPQVNFILTHLIK